MTDQTTRLAYRYRLYPTKSQVSVLNETLTTCRLVYNSLVHQRTVAYALEGKASGYSDQKRAIASWKPEHFELGEVYSQVLQHVCKRVDLAFQAFFRRVKLGCEVVPEVLEPSEETVGMTLCIKLLEAW